MKGLKSLFFLLRLSKCLKFIKTNTLVEKRQAKQELVHICDWSSILPYTGQWFFEIWDKVIFF